MSRFRLEIHPRGEKKQRRRDRGSVVTAPLNNGILSPALLNIGRQVVKQSQTHLTPEAPMPTPEQRLVELGIQLREVPRPRWAYAPSVRSGNLLFVSGQIATRDGAILHPGKLGREVDVAAGQEAAR